ncbi:DUF4135 domain-containing protein [Enterococcus faecalis]|uniref:DUF4135 domain-containing protein n=1 Tax=Enterococcus faecalis TaxID=1351 RepID=UPI0025AF3CDD|nr:DUF4135 domain-containing protein [Enterococcus faecalis]MDN3081775.1 DUF4135 domain-containing protein [Enterococcus faecalis]
MNCFDKGKALTIEERMSLIKNKIFDDKNSSNIQRWLNRKTTVDSELFSKILNINNWKLEEFNHCIDENFKIDSYSDRVTYSDFDSLIASIEDQNNLPSTYVKLIRPFLTKLENGLIVDFQDKLSEKAIENIFDCLASRLINLSLKVFVLEMDFIKNSNGLHGETSKERFINFIDLYDDKEKLLNLYQKYPVMTRKLSITTLYFIDFMNEFLNNLFQSWDSIEDTFFDTEEKIYVESLIFEKGDTHEKGKSVVIIEFNLGKIVYKPRNLYIEKNFQKIIKFFSYSNGFLNMDIPKSLYNSTFTFVQFIEQEPCNNEEEIERFYQRYGQLIALIYLTNGSDIHFENVISHGEYPVIVDYETLFSVPIKLEGRQENIFSEIVGFIRNSVSSSIMLPGKMQLDSEGVRIQNVFENTPRIFLIDKIKNIDSENIAKQIGIIMMKIKGEEGVVKQDVSSLVISKEDSYLQIAEKLAEKLIDSAYIDKNEEYMTWLVINDGVVDEFDLGASKVNFYDGLIGIASLFKSLYKVTGKVKYQRYFDYLVKTTMDLLDTMQTDSAYVGFHSFLQLFSIIEKEDTNYERITHYLNLLQQNSQNFLEREGTVDWLLGYGGIIPLYIDVYKKTKDNQYLEIAIFLGNKLIMFAEKDTNVMKNIGIGHGISGLLISMVELYKVTKDRQYLEYIKKLNERMSISLVQENEDVVSWCNGILGYLLGQSYLHKNNIKSALSDKEKQRLLLKIKNQYLESDCLCHGNCGIIQFYIDLYLLENSDKYLEHAKKIGNKMISEIIKNEYIQIREFEGFDNIGLFNGISGVAYTLVRLLEPENVPSVFV